MTRDTGDIGPFGTDHRDIREGVIRLCRDFPGEYWRRCDRDREYPGEFVEALSRAGYLAALIPTRYGGSQLPLSAAAAIVEEIHRSGGNAAACHAQMYTMGTLLRHGSQDQKDRYLPEIASGKLRLQAFAVTEPDSGSDTSALSTTARRDGAHYLVSGQKLWTSRAEHSDLMMLLCRTTPASGARKKTDGLSVLLVDLRHAPADTVTVTPVRTMMNHATTQIFFDDMPVPVGNLVGEEGRGFAYLLSGLNAERILIAAECLGDARWFIEKAVAYANERRVFDRPIGQNQAVQFPITTAYAKTRAAALMLAEALRLYDDGGNPGEEANLAKLLCAEASWHAAETCLQIHGGFGFAEDFDIERKFRETRLYQVAPISTNLILSYLGEHVLGMPRSY